MPNNVVEPDDHTLKWKKPDMKEYVYTLWVHLCEV